MQVTISETGDVLSHLWLCVGARTGDRLINDLICELYVYKISGLINSFYLHQQSLYTAHIDGRIHDLVLDTENRKPISLTSHSYYSLY